jgi:hypothetical protein
VSKIEAPTEDEVLAALLRETVGEVRPYWSPASRVDVSDRIARSRGWNGSQGYERTPAGHNPTRASVIGKWVSIKAVQKVLDRLYSEDRVHAFYGSSRFIAGSYGTSPRQVYYLSQEALDLMLAARRKAWLERAEQDALEAAQQKVLEEHAADVERYRQENLTTWLPKEPDWQAMLNDDEAPEEKA